MRKRCAVLKLTWKLHLIQIHKKSRLLSAILWTHGFPNYTPKWQVIPIIPLNDRSYPHLTDHTPIRQIRPWNHRSYPGITDHNLEWQIIPWNDGSYPGMTDHTPESQIIHWNDRSYPGIVPWGYDEGMLRKSEKNPKIIVFSSGFSVHRTNHTPISPGQSLHPKKREGVKRYAV